MINLILVSVERRELYRVLSANKNENKTEQTTRTKRVPELLMNII